MSEPATPEEAVAEALRRARERLAAGGYADAPELDAIRDEPGSAVGRLHEWALIEVDPAGVRSTRALGGPITLLKRALLRLLRQYHGELEAQVSRFNVQMLVHVGSLEARIEELEQRVSELERRKPE